MQNPRVLVCAACGAIFGGLSGKGVADIVAATLHGTTPIDRMIGQSISSTFMIAFVLGGVVGGATLFAFMAGIGFVGAPAAIGIAFGCVLGAVFGLPESVVASELGALRAMALILWEWIFGAVFGFLGSLVGRALEKSRVL